MSFKAGAPLPNIGPPRAAFTPETQNPVNQGMVKARFLDNVNPT